MIEFRPLNHLSQYLERLVKGRLWLKVIIGLILGVGLGILINPSTGLTTIAFSQHMASWLDLPGQIFMKLVQMIMIPLVFTSIILGIISNTSDNLKTFGLSLLIYFILTTGVAIFIGIIVTLIFNPGQYIFAYGGLPNSSSTFISAKDSNGLIEDIPKAISNLIPDNPLEAILTGEMLGVVIFTVIIGVAIAQLNPNTARPIVRFSEAIQKICMIVVSWAMQLVPYAVFGLMAALLSRTGFEVFIGLGYYMLIIIIGLLLLMLFYLLLVGIILRKSPFTFLRAIKAPQLLAFSTAVQQLLCHYQ